MKKLYKYIATILVSIILTNALLSNVALAEKEDPFLSQTTTDHNKILTANDIDKYGNTGEATGATNAVRPVNTINNGTNLAPTSKVHDRDTNLQ